VPNTVAKLSSPFVRIDVEPFKTLLMSLDVVMGLILTAELGMRCVAAQDSDS
jgi:hypothetical protein